MNNDSNINKKTNETEEEAGKKEDTGKKELRLPTKKLEKDDDEDYILECWKVKDGTLVRRGETVAMACHARVKNANTNSKDGKVTGSASTAQSSTDDVKHKRPTRRKRPNNSASAAAATDATPLSGSNIQSDGKTNLEEDKNIQISFAERFGQTKKNSSSKGDSGDNKSTNSSEETAAAKNQSISILAPIAGFVRIGGEAIGKADVIGFIEPCSHPAMVSGLCGVCGIPMTKSSVSDSDYGNSSNDNNQSNSSGATSSRAMSQVTVSGGLTFTVTKEEGIQMGRQHANRLRQLKRLSLVLDLDHTLVHATADVRARKHLSERDDVRSLLLPMSEEANSGHLWMQHFVKLRPNVKEFLETCSTMYEIGVYTAGTRQYAEEIATVLCRHLVGAKLDRIELDQLGFNISRAEAELRSQQAPETPNAEQRTQIDNKTVTSGKADGVTGTKEKEKDKSDDAEDVKKAQKKRKVTFAAVEEEPKKTKEQHNKITPVDVQIMRAEFEKATQLEKEATEMRKRLFGRRIVSRSDVGDLGRDVKSLRRIFPCGGTMAAVVDDREDVWANAKDNKHIPRNKDGNRLGEPPENLLLVKPYHWQPFLGFADINNTSGVDLTEILNGEQSKESDSTSESDRQLLWTADILKRLHSRFYSQGEADNEKKTVPEVLYEMRKEVLLGEQIVLSGLVPLDKQNQDNNYTQPRPPVVRYVESLGASVLPTIQPGTSLVIAAKDGTDKTLMARRLGIPVLKVSWLMDCFWSISRQDVSGHVIAGTGIMNAQRGHSPINGTMASSSSAAASANLVSWHQEDEESDEDEFAAEFEKELMS